MRDRLCFKITGHQALPIIDSGGRMLSALQIEAVLLEHPPIQECAVVGVSNDTQRKAVSAAAVIGEDAALVLAGLRAWCRERLGLYKIPRRRQLVSELPPNVRGKVTKQAVRALFPG